MNLIRVWLLISLMTAATSLMAAPLEYNLKAQQIAEDTWLVEGLLENFSRDNGGNIVNIVFIRTSAGVVLIDTGPSKRYGEALRDLIFKTTGDIVQDVFLTHHHPDHVFGNQAFANARIWGTPGLTERLRRDGEDFSNNLYRAVGDWMRGTEVTPPNQVLTQEQMQVGNHQFRFYRFSGHTGDDLVILDETTGVLLAGDMLFYQRALTTPQSPGFLVWADQLEQIRQLEATLLVPGHGPLAQGNEAIEQTQAYLVWLDQAFTEAARAGLTMTETMDLPIPEQFAGVRMSRYELIRTVNHLYPRYESDFLGNP